MFHILITKSRFCGRMEKNMKKPLHMLTGVNIGDYGFDPDKVMDQLKHFKIGKNNGGIFTFVRFRVDQKRPTTEQLREWAQAMKENELYFMIVNNYPRVGELYTTLTKEEIEMLHEVGGEYFMGDEVGEFGGWYASKHKGYFGDGSSENPVQGLKTCDEAVEIYKRQLTKITDLLRANGAKAIDSCQAVTLTQYDYEAGIDHCFIETAPRNMEQIMNFGRGAARAYRKEFLGNWLAHEFYGGYHQFDPLKAKRFTAEYYLSYLAGYDAICLESGFHELHSHLTEILPEEHPLTKSYLKEAEDFAKFCNKDVRPGKNGPITKVAFVQGNLDGFGWGNSSSLWGQYYDEKWGFAAPEFSYRILDEVYHAQEWNDGKNFGDYDYSGTPGYGTYDVIPATCPLDVMKQYEWVIFCGWNTMTPEIAETFKKYVEQGGNLLITAAHMRDSVDRAEKGKFCDFDWESFLGVKLTDEIVRANDGYKFVKFSTVDGVMYPGTYSLLCDPAWSAGYTNYVKIEPTTATPVCFMHDSFSIPEDRTQYSPSFMPVVTENKVGEGNVIFMANSEYPGAPEIYPLYKIMVKSVLAASHRTSDLKVIGSDKIRFAMFEDDEKYKLYIFNSDFNLEQKVKIIFRGEERKIEIDSVGLEMREYKK